MFERRFEKALYYDRERAQYALDRIREWYMPEREAGQKELSSDDMLAVRKEEISPSMSYYQRQLVNYTSN
jgi:hypothetical protein